MENRKLYIHLSIEAEVYEALKQYKEFHGKNLSDSVWQLLGKPERPAKKGFGERVYPFHSLEVGESCVIPWPGKPGSKENGRVSGAVYQHGRRTNAKFKLSPNVSGLTVTRLK